MSNYTKHKTTIMPKITQSLRIDKRSLNERKSYTRKEDLYYRNSDSANLPVKLDTEKKPGSSMIEKNQYIFFQKYQQKPPRGRPMQ